MQLIDLLNLQAVPAPWQEAENIPWNEPGFSTRMLREHLDQSHDAASRRFGTIDRHVAWIHERLLHGQAGRVLDLGCGPGLYSHRLARLGHSCRGIDYSPASVRYAREVAEAEALDCAFVERDIRLGEWGQGYDLAMLIYGEFNVFRPSEAQALLDGMCSALRPGGRLLIEYQTWESVQGSTQPARTWYSSDSGLFCEQPHMLLTEHYWDEASATHIVRYYLLEAQTGEVTLFGQTTQAYKEASLQEMLLQAGFCDIVFGGALDAPDDPLGDAIFCTVTARRSGH